MMRRVAGAAIPTALALFLLAAPLRAEHVLSSPQFQRGSGIEMKITNFYEDIPPAGFLPLRVEVKNGSKAPRTWTFDTTHSKYGMGSMRATFSLRVDAETDRTFDLLVPVASETSSSSRYSNLSIIVSGYAVTNGSSNEHASGGGKTPTAFLGMGEALSVKNWGPLRDSFDKKSSNSLDGTPLDPTLLPADWRGLAGFGAIIFEDSEWRRIPAAQRSALLEWVAQGGRLILCTADANASSELPEAGRNGVGQIEHWPLGEDFQEKVKTMLPTISGSAATDAIQNYTWKWKLAEAVGRPEPPQALIIIFVLLFAAIIGPLNFLVFAPSGNRHRLFWTTPLISLVASVIMGLFIVLSEGFGGNGQRFGVLLNLPNLNKNVLWQEQVSRTGVLSSSAFVLTDPVLPLPITLRKNTSSPTPAENGKSYVLDGATWSGDWFSSRTTQAQLFTAISPTRARLQVNDDSNGKPVAVSSFEVELEDLWYFDGAGKIWWADHVKPGEKRTLQAAYQHDFSKWWKDALEPAGEITRSRAARFNNGDSRVKFFASTAQPSFLSSLSSIRWKQGQSLILGQPVQ